MSQEATISIPVDEEIHSSGVDMLLLLWLVSSMLLWLLAFLELPPEGAEWLKRTQLACFGTDGSGLPSVSGWITLTLGPLMFLGGLLVSLPRECRSSIELLRRGGDSREDLGGSFKLLAGLVSLLLVAEIAWVGRSIFVRSSLDTGITDRQLLEHLPVDYPQTTTPAPDFNLVDQHGEVRSLASFRGKPVLLSFVFAHCPSVCPTLVQAVTVAHRTAGLESSFVVFITLDPWRDTPSRIPELAKKWELGVNEFFLSGSPEEINNVLNAFGMPRDRDEQNGDVVHPALVKVLDQEGMTRFTLNAPSATWLSDALKRLNQ